MRLFYNKSNVCVLMITVILTGCQKFLQIAPPKTQIVSQSVFTSNATAIAAVNGMYSDMGNIESFFNGEITLLAGLSADELINQNNTSYQQFYANKILPSNSNLTNNLWAQAYQFIYQSNAVIEGLSTATGVSAPIKKQLTGESLFIRGYCYFYLVNLFGNTPLITSTNYEANSKIARSGDSIVYRQIMNDLGRAQDSLVMDYSFSNGERVRPNKWAAAAMLARVYLYLKDWPDAAQQSSNVINNANYALINDPDSVFLANSTEAIFQLEPVIPGLNTGEGYMFVQSAGIPQYAALTNSLLNVFETGDKRKTSWTDSYTDAGLTYYFPYKYKVNNADQLSEYYTVLRLAEQYLIRAEARVMQNDFTGAQADINIIRSRAGLSSTTANDQASLLSAIVRERQTELFCEWGHRWLDVKRLGLADATFGTEKPSWKPNAVLFPIPQVEIQNDPALIQNLGY